MKKTHDTPQVPHVQVGPLPSAMAPDSEANPEHESVELRMGLGGWAVVAALLVVITWAVPRLGGVVESFQPKSDWRMPTESSEDYWQLRRWTRLAGHDERVLLMGDSVVWGEFGPPDQALAAQLNLRAGEPRFANAGLKGLCPLAMESLIKDVVPVGEQVGCVVHFNPVWLTSPQRDLSEDRPTMVNHQMLLPQLWPNVPAYQPDLNTRLGNLVGRKTEIFRWVQHLRIDDYGNQDLQRWSLEHPLSAPWEPLDFKARVPADEPASRAATGRRNLDAGQRPLRQIDYEWVGVETTQGPIRSLQLAAFYRCIESLQQRDCPVFCLIGQLNPDMQTAESRTLEAAVRGTLIEWLYAHRVEFYVLPSDAVWMADASHPLPEGYQTQAEQLWSDDRFQEWLKRLQPSAL